MAKGRHKLSKTLSKAKAARTEAPAAEPDTDTSAPVVSPTAPPGGSGRGYRRGDVSGAYDDGYVWMVPSPTAWPNVLPDGHNGRPPGPRTQVVGYNLADQRVRTVFRDGTQWQYSGVSAQEWERIRRTASTGRFINRVLNYKSYGPDSFTAP